MAPSGLLVSSPTRMAHNNSVIFISSSPEFPSISEFLSKSPKRPALRTESNAAPIPDTAIRSFRTAANVWASSHAEVEGQIAKEHGAQKDGSAPTTDSAPEQVIRFSPVLAPAPAPAKPRAARKPRTAATTRKKKTDNTTPADAEDEPPDNTTALATVAPPVAKPARKRRTAKSAADGQTTLPKGRVTKPAAKEKAPRRKSEIVSEHFATPAPDVVLIEDESLIMEPAMRRKTDWTPPPENRPENSGAGSSPAKGTSSSAHQDAQSAKTFQGNVFKSLHDTYGRNADGDDQLSGGAGASVMSDVLGKRKLIQMVITSTTSGGNTTANTPDTSPAKTKAPKKKLRTITDLATAAYRVQEEIDISASTEASKQDSLLDYFNTGDDTTGGASKAKGGKGKATKKPAKPRVSKKKAEPHKQVLLSPASAMRQVSRQDFVFGTASQLATEEDPDLLRVLHEAMKESNHPDSDPFASPGPVGGDVAIRRRLGNKLWAAGARDDGGDLVDLEVMDLTESTVPLEFSLPSLSAVSPTKDRGKERVQLPAASERVEIEIASSDFDTFDSMLESPQFMNPPKSLFFSTQNVVSETTTLQVSLETIANPRDDPLPSLAPELDFEPPPSNQEHNQLLEQSQSGSSPKMQLDGPPRPKYELYTDAKLAKEIASYGFKALKKRTAMIALLDQCWAGKTQTNLGSKAPQAAMTTSTKQAAPAPLAASVASPSRPRGRPRKSSVAATATAAEAEPPQPVKRPRGRPKKDAAAVASPPKLARNAKGKSKAKAAAPPEPVAVMAPPPLPAPKSPRLPAITTPKRRKAPAKAALEIPDSESDSDPFEDPFASSPMSLSGKQTHDVFSSPSNTQMEVSITEDTEMSLLAASPTTQQTAMFGHITKAVTSAPPTKDPENPSWHEKMLMYDPVILEDLTAWLNAGQLDRVGYDGEVAPADVKRWCESKSVCCLWRVNLHGKERKRF
ncbi:structure-specific endonuclease subunit SLX4 [Lasiosphaeria hispida]|uniref:Structure-specific endonuclease subunit SLX4 n=1 Tax=Lasiosphaeria hispida TaxID=260671 RepID=A0AAJ0H747_9PEZI|nr:structure-specific endonuclease subunit SLX4 [Lasiosphaeria hispida]